jgi:hypothetical protein
MDLTKQQQYRLGTASMSNGLIFVVCRGWLIPSLLANSVVAGSFPSFLAHFVIAGGGLDQAARIQSGHSQ